MIRSFSRNWLLSVWKLPAVFCVICVTAAILIIVPLGGSAAIQGLINSVCGWIFLLTFIANAVHLLGTAVYYFLKMKNLRALWQITGCVLIWFIGVLLFMRVAVEADPPSPYQTKQTVSSKQETEAQMKATDTLLGPAALMLPISPQQTPPTQLSNAPNLLLLEKHHPELLETYLQQAPRWSFTANDDTFYSKPGHVVLETSSAPDIPGIVHAAIRTISAGSSMPQGYQVIRPGDPLPEASETNKNEAPDLALELGGKRYLLLAWRGPGDRAYAFNALNAAIDTIDAQFAPLAKEPSSHSMAKLLAGTTCIRGTKAEMRLAHIPTQMGIYQAEIYANPRQSGTLILVIRDKETSHPLRIYSQKAKYSDKAEELYRHDISPAMEAAYRRTQEADAEDSIPAHAPFFYIKAGDSLSYFDITAEVLFSPANSPTNHPQLLLKNHYSVRAYEKALPALPPVLPEPLPELPEPEEDPTPAPDIHSPAILPETELH